MSCDSSSNKISKIACAISGGVSQLAGKRGFYAGLALAGMGLAAGTVALARRQTKQGPVQVIQFKEIPQLPSRTKLKPVSPQAGQSCAGCQTPAGGKPGPWYNLAGRLYCPDCAPDRVRQAGVDLLLPALAQPASVAGRRASDNQAPSAARIQMTRPLPPERRLDVKLHPNRVRVRLGETQDGWQVVEQAYVVLRRDGLGTGLAVTPTLKQKNERLIEDTGQWWITHIDSGKGVSGPYSSPTEARELARILAQLDWTRSEDEFTTEELRRASATANAYRQTLVKAISPQASAVQIDMHNSGKVQKSEPLVGKIVADGYGGVARVVEESEDLLFMIDHLGQRYEVSRNEVRLPDQQDFEMSRVAMSFGPAGEEAVCAGCGRSTGQSGAGEMWYKMGWKSHCEPCARQYAAEEAYILDEEVGSEL